MQKLEQLVAGVLKSVNGSARAQHDTVATAIDEISSLAHELGLDVVDKVNNIGNFKGVLTTDTRGVSVDNVTTLGRLAFNKFAPTDMQVELGSPPEQGTWAVAMPNQLKGEFEGTPDSYVVPAIFKIVDPRANNPAEQEPLYGVSSAIGSFEQCPDNPGRRGTRACSNATSKALTEVTDSRLSADQHRRLHTGVSTHAARWYHNHASSLVPGFIHEPDTTCTPPAPAPPPVRDTDALTHSLTQQIVCDRCWLIVYFRKLRLQLAPHLVSKPAALRRWLDLLKEHNPGMGEDGRVEIDLGTPPKGSLDYIVMTRNLQISKGNLGSVVILQRETA
ncbi:MAG: hypothetical protein WDW38_007065 [Sanguina aurantia]